MTKAPATESFNTFGDFGNNSIAQSQKDAGQLGFGNSVSTTSSSTNIVNPFLVSAKQNPFVSNTSEKKDSL